MALVPGQKLPPKIDIGPSRRMCSGQLDSAPYGITTEGHFLNLRLLTTLPRVINLRLTLVQT